MPKLNISVSYVQVSRQPMETTTIYATGLGGPVWAQVSTSAPSWRRNRFTHAIFCSGRRRSSQLFGVLVCTCNSCYTVGSAKCYSRVSDALFPFSFLSGRTTNQKSVLFADLYFFWSSAIFASIFLKEKLGAIGKIGCLLSVVGAVIVVLHAPEDKNVTSIDELLFYALQPGK